MKNLELVSKRIFNTNIKNFNQFTQIDEKNYYFINDEGILCGINIETRNVFFFILILVDCSNDKFKKR